MRKTLILLLQIPAVLPVIILTWFFYMPEAELLNITIPNPYYEYTADLPLWEYLVICFIVFSFFTVLILTVLNVFFTLVKRRREKLRKHYEKLYTDYLVKYFFTQSQVDPARLVPVAKIRKITRTSGRVTSFLKVYIKIQENVAVNLGEPFIELINVLGLWNKIEKLLTSHNFSNNLLALKIISSLGIRKYNGIIFRYTKSSNYALRTEAIAALMHLSGKEGFSALIDHPHHLSLLDANVILNAVLRNEDVDIDFTSLLKSDKPEKILIAVLVARYRKLRCVTDEIKNMIGHPDDHLNYELWSAWLALEEDPIKRAAFIISNFKGQSEKIKLLILSMDMRDMGDEYESFVSGVVREDDSLDVKTGAMRLLFSNDFDSISQFTSSDNEKISKAYMEVIDFNN